MSCRMSSKAERAKVMQGVRVGVMQGVMQRVMQRVMA